MIFSQDFENHVRSLVGEGGQQPVSPEDLLEQWRNLIENCETGYFDILDEYNFDLLAREDIEKVLQSGQACAMQDMSEFRRQVDSLDQRLKAIQLPHPVLSLDEFYWWECYPLRYGGPEIAKEYYDRYGISIEIVPSR